MSFTFYPNSIGQDQKVQKLKQRGVFLLNNWALTMFQYKGTLQMGGGDSK